MKNIVKSCMRMFFIFFFITVLCAANRSEISFLFFQSCLTCSFYVPSTQTWSSKGCHHYGEQAEENDDVITCHCNHTTSFAVVVVRTRSRVLFLLLV